MKEIKLSTGQTAKVSDEDYDFLNQWSWSLQAKGYPRRGGSEKGVKFDLLMHTAVFARMGFSGEPDHKDRDKLNNQRTNLRPATSTQNQMNREKGKNNTSGYKGVSFDTWTKKWVARISHNGVQKNLGRFPTPEEAAKAYNKAAHTYYGEYACLNKVPQ